MNEDYQFKIIQGTFTPPEALKIIMDMINSKILYHNVEMFSSNIRFGKPSEFSKIRLEELNTISRILNEKMAEAGRMGKRLKVDGVINISLID